MTSYFKIIIHPLSSKKFKKDFMDKTQESWRWQEDKNYRYLDVLYCEVRLNDINDILEISNLIREKGGLPIFYVSTTGDNFFEILVIEEGVIDYRNYLYRKEV